MPASSSVGSVSTRRAGSSASESTSRARSTSPCPADATTPPHPPRRCTLHHTPRRCILPHTTRVERRDVPPHSGYPVLAPKRSIPQLFYREKITRCKVNRRSRARRGGTPRGAEELAVRVGEAVGSADNSLRLKHRDCGSGRQIVADRHEPIKQSWCERLHALDRYALGHPRQYVREVRKLVQHFPRPLANRLGEEHLPAWTELNLVNLRRERALIGNRKRTQVINLITEEFHPHRVLCRGREDIEDAAAHRKLATSGDHIDASVCEVNKLR